MAEPDIPFIDPHFHLWDLTDDAVRYGWLTDQTTAAAWGSSEGLRRNYLLDDYLRDTAGVGLVGAVHIDVGDHDDPVAETRWLQGVADERGFPHGIIGYADLAREDVAAILDGHGEFANFRGIRQSMNYHSDKAKTFLDRPEVSRTPEWRRGFAELGKRGLSFDLQLYYPQMGEFCELAGEFPGTQIILNHTGMPIDGPDHFDGWLAGMRLIAQAPNVACKISGLGMNDHEWTAASIRPYVETAIELFGVQRCMFASNFPVDSLFSTYATLITAFREITETYPRDEKLALFCDNAKRFYRL